MLYYYTLKTSFLRKFFLIAHRSGSSIWLRPPGRIMKLLSMLVFIFGMVFWWDSPLSFAAETEPKKIFKEYGCVKCHSVSAYGITIVEAGEDDEEEEEDEDDEEEAVEPPDLSDVGTKVDKKFMSKYLRKKIANKEERKHKKRFKGSKAELKIIVEWLATLNKPSTLPNNSRPK